jgi:hypothetical protein
MSKQATRRPPTAKRRPQQRKGRTALAAKSAKGGSNRTLWIVVIVVLLVGAGLVIALASSSKKSHNASIKDRQPASASLVSKVTGVPNSVINAVGAGNTVADPLKKVSPSVAVLKTSDGKPRIVYVGAEYCPFCATERWAMVNALSRFGTFKHLQVTTSSSTDVPPTISTFSFHGATYDSPYIQFEPVEEQTNTTQPLDVPTAEQNDLMTKYDVAPYTDRAGAIPFMDFANQYIVSGASYDANSLQGLTHNQIAADLSNPSSGITQGAIGTANKMTAAICKLTGDKPANVCSQPAIKALEKTM